MKILKWKFFLFDNPSLKIRKCFFTLSPTRVFKCAPNSPSLWHLRFVFSILSTHTRPQNLRINSTSLLTSGVGGVCCAGSISISVAGSHWSSFRSVELTVATSIALGATISAAARSVAIHAVAWVMVSSTIHVGSGGWWARCWSDLLANLQLNVQLLASRVLQVRVVDRLQKNEF